MEEDSGIGAELTRLADLYERGALSDGEFEKHKRQLLNGVPWWRKKPLAGLGIAGAVVAAIALTVGLSTTPSGKPASKSLNKVEIATVSATSYQLQEAISYADKYVGDNHDAGLCLEFMQEAYRAAGISLSGEPTAAAYWAANPNGFTRVSASAYGTPPAGALLFRGSRPGYTAGHVALSVGNGTAVSTSAFPYYGGIHEDPRVFIMTLSQRSSSAYNYVGYLIPGVVSPPSLPSPVASPTITPVQTSSPGSSSPPRSASTPQPASSGSTMQPASGGSSVQPASGGSSSAGVSGGGASGGGTSGGSNSDGGTSGGGTSGGGSGSASSGSSSPSSPPASSPPSISATSPPPPQTYSETVGGVSHTWTNYSNAGGDEGPSIPSNETVQIACKVTGFVVADGNSWWYRIAQSPWSNQYYVSADAFYNNGATSGSLHGTPFVDPAVPNC